MTLVFVGDACCDHSDHGGYHQLCSMFPEAGWLSARALLAGHLMWIRAASTGAATEGDLPGATIHNLYGDYSGRELLRVLRVRVPGATVVATAHMPSSRLQQAPAAMSALREADAVIAVSCAQAGELAQLEVDVPLHAVPHGVWTQTFRRHHDTRFPLRSCRPVLVVGTHLRDWAATQYVLATLGELGVPSVVVGDRAGAHLSISHPLVHVRGRVSEGDLLTLYNQAAAILLAVSDATASNALLEAMAAGCPVVAPKLPSLTEYLGDSRDLYTPERPQEAVALLRRYAHDPLKRAIRSRQLASRAGRFDWRALRPQYEAVYQSLTG